MMQSKATESIVHVPPLSCSVLLELHCTAAMLVLQVLESAASAHVYCTAQYFPPTLIVISTSFYSLSDVMYDLYCVASNIQCFS